MALIFSGSQIIVTCQLIPRFVLAVIFTKHPASRSCLLCRVLNALTTAWWVQDAQRLARTQVESAHAIFDRQQFLDVALHSLISTEHKPLAVIEHKRR